VPAASAAAAGHRDDTAQPRPVHLLRPQLRRVEVFQRQGIWVHPGQRRRPLGLGAGA
jgi:hypothetical protein